MKQAKVKCTLNSLKILSRILENTVSLDNIFQFVVFKNRVSFPDITKILSKIPDLSIMDNNGAFLDALMSFLDDSLDLTLYLNIIISKPRVVNIHRKTKTGTKEKHRSSID